MDKAKKIDKQTRKRQGYSKKEWKAMREAHELEQEEMGYHK